MKRWISFSSHLVAGITSFAALSVIPSVVYGLVALERSWQSGTMGDPSSVFNIPLFSALAAGMFAAVLAPPLAVVSQDWTKRFGWNAAVCPVLLACFATILFSLGNDIFNWNWGPVQVIGSGVGLGAAFITYWVPLRWTQKTLRALDTKYDEWRRRWERQGHRVPVSF